jgi:hypothetical protein
MSAMPLPYFATDTIRLYAAIQTYNRRVAAILGD